MTSRKSSDSSSLRECLKLAELSQTTCLLGPLSRALAGRELNDARRLEASSKTLLSSSEDVPTDERAAKFEECFVNVGTSLEASA